jgi:pimeloyl-ACP methyl ester carboxylesterase
MSTTAVKGTVRSADGTTIAWTKQGEGPAVVMVDGAFCYRENGPSSDVAPLLAPNFTVYTYDRRGRGESGDSAPYAIAREVEDLDAIIRQAGGSASVFGMSSGASLALQAGPRATPGPASPVLTACPVSRSSLVRK